MLVAGTTARAAREISELNRRLLQAKRRDRPIVGVFEIEVDPADPAFQILDELHSALLETKNLAEHESLAWALTHGRDAVLVAVDKRAVLTALAELGRGRVAHPFDVWIDFFTRHWITKGQFVHLCELTEKHDRGLSRRPGRISRRFYRVRTR